MAPAHQMTTTSALLQRVFGVEPREYSPVAWSFVYFFCVLSSYYILRPVREAMAVGSGPDTIPYLFIGTFVAMLVATPIFGAVASRFPRRTFLPWVYLFFIANILILSVISQRYPTSGPGGFTISVLAPFQEAINFQSR